MKNNKAALVVLVTMLAFAPILNWYIDGVEESWVNAAWRITMFFSFLIGYCWKRKRRLEENMVDFHKSMS